MQIMGHTRKDVLKWVIWGFAILFLFYEFFLRVFPSVMVEDLMFAFKVDAAALGSLSAFYFYIYAPMQIPVGMLMDRFGARNLLTFAALICAVGYFFFSFALALKIAELGRAFIGLGSSLAFIGMVYISSHWFSAHKLALLIGLGNSIGMFGAAFGEGPLSLLVERIGWRETVWLFGVVGLALSLAIYLFVRNKPMMHPQESQKKLHYKQLLGQLGVISQNPQTWFNGIGALCFYMATGAFAGLWAVPFLQTAFGVSKETASFASSMVFVGWIVGGPIIGHYSDKRNSRIGFVKLFSLLSLAAISLLIYIPRWPVFFIFLWMFLLGVFSSAQLLNFSLAIEFNPFRGKGTAIALTNFIIAAGTATLQPLVGLLLDLFWTGKTDAGIRVYAVESYRLALSVFPALFIGAFIFFCFLHKKIRSKT